MNRSGARQTETRVLPSRQRLDAFEVAVGERDLRLVVKHELTGTDRVT